MGRRRVLWLALALLLVWTPFVLNLPFSASAAADIRAITSVIEPPARSLAALPLADGGRTRPALSNEAYIRPAFRREMRELRPAIIAAAQRHNQPHSGLSDREFAVVIAALLYNENFGWFEEEVAPVREFTPLYQQLQLQVNHAGANLTVWPANLRPSVAAEILAGTIPMPASSAPLTRTIRVAGSQIDPASYANQNQLYAALTREIAYPPLAVEYLAANLERGLYRARAERVPITWRTLAAWHNQGIVAPRELATNATAADYVRRASAYLPAAHGLIDGEPPCQRTQCSLAERVTRALEWAR
ncbi:MAG: hypothetical protein H7Z42_18315 [Roseiflexaceae bacterium]|nr:hypothetical protein [Roseiflexaceae bacterium]